MYNEDEKIEYVACMCTILAMRRKRRVEVKCENNILKCVGKGRGGCVSSRGARPPSLPSRSARPPACLAAALDPLAFLAAALGPVAFLATALGPLACLAVALGPLAAALGPLPWLT